MTFILAPIRSISCNTKTKPYMTGHFLLFSILYQKSWDNIAQIIYIVANASIFDDLSILSTLSPLDTFYQSLW